MAPAEQVLHILGQHDMVWCGILAPKALQALAVVLHEERGLISQHRIRHIVGQIKELSVGCGVLMLMQESNMTCLNIFSCALLS